MNRQATNISTPNHCIWCLREPPNVTFNSDSHVLPECTGNKQQILPKGIVCDKCNYYFGTKVERKLINDPIFHVIAYCLKLRHPKTKKLLCSRIFNEQNPAVEGEHQAINWAANINTHERTLTLNIDYSSKGQIKKSYTDRDLAFLSRAVHKIAFESLAHGVFVEGKFKDIDLFDSRFYYVREWSRRGAPHNKIRPMLRRQIPELMKPDDKDKKVKFWYEFHKRSANSLVVSLNLFGDLYGVSLTSSPDTVENDLKSWAQKDLNYPVWLMGEKFIALT